MNIKTKKRSLLKKYFDEDLYLEISKITMMSDVDNNEKGQFIKALLKEKGVPFEGLGPGTNRMGILIDGYAVKIALDKDGKIDNQREMLYTDKLQPYVVKVYECDPKGLLMVCEFVEIFTLNEFHASKDEIREILSQVTEQYLVGDVGITGKNYVNWGIKSNGQICMLDFAYIYSVKYNVFNCTCSDDSILKYDDNFVFLTCPNCGRKYTFGEIRRKITRVQQNAEIGNIKRVGYNISNPEELVDIIPEFEPKLIHEKQKKKKDKESIKDVLKRLQKQELTEKDINNVYDYWKRKEVD